MSDTPGPQPPARLVLLACLPALLLGLFIRIWVSWSPLMVLTSDEAFTGIQALRILQGQLRTVPDGNDYGATTETYLLAPLLTVWHGVWPLRLVALLLSFGAAVALYRLASPFLGRVGGAVVALTGWGLSGAVVLTWMHLYMGYTTGFIAQVATLALASSAITSDDRLPWTAALAGLGAGLAMWSHPMFGIVAVIALIPACVIRRRCWGRWWLPAAGGGLLGLAPWLGHVLVHGLPRGAEAGATSTYLDRLLGFGTGLMPRLVGLRLPEGGWIPAPGIGAAIAAVALILSLLGLVLLWRRSGPAALPLLVSGIAVFPALAVFPPLAYVDDARYGLPFIPTLVMGWAAWLLLLPTRTRRSPWLVAVIPTAWMLLTCVPVLSAQISDRWQDPDLGARQVVAILDEHDIRFLAGNYWGTYLMGYLSDGRLIVTADITVRLPDLAREVAAADPWAVARIYPHGLEPTLPLGAENYQLQRVGDFDLYLPHR